MVSSETQAMAELLKAFVQPWHDAVTGPAKAQKEVLNRLLTIYSQTDYGAEHGAFHIETIDDYRRSFPVTTYEDYKPLIKRVMAGETKLMLNEEPIGWAITRGTTRGNRSLYP